MHLNQMPTMRLAVKAARCSPNPTIPSSSRSIIVAPTSCRAPHKSPSFAIRLDSKRALHTSVAKSDSYSSGSGAICRPLLSLRSSSPCAGRSRNPPSVTICNTVRLSSRFSTTSTTRKQESVSPPDPTSSYAAPITSPQDPNSPPSTPSPSSSSNSDRPNQLTWNAFLALRRTRRRYNLLASLTSAFATTGVGVSVLARQNIETAGIFGLDPFIVLGLATAGSGALGWLVGPFLGNAVFGWVHRRSRGEIEEKERDLYARIKRHRVDPSSSSAGNPVPDYYGEKIGSVAEYRTWMKDQRAYNKRRQNFL